MLNLASTAAGLPLAGASSSGLHGPIAIILFVAFMIFAIAVILYRRRKGGPGPQVNWVPKSLRGKVNEHYEKEGWQKPYDDDGNRNPDRDEI